MTNSNPTPIEIDAERALALLEKAMGTRGADYNYRLQAPDLQCNYVRDGKPDCIVGVALVDAGVPIPVLQRAEKTAASHVCEKSFEGGPECGVANCTSTGIDSLWFRDFLRAEAGLALTDEAMYVLSAAQMWQDSHRTWGEAVQAARTTAETGERPSVLVG